MAGQRLSDHEREEIRAGIEREESLTTIASGLGRAVSTVSREVGRNGGRDAYNATRAGRQAAVRARRPRPCKLDDDMVLRLHVRTKMLAGYSPCATSRLLAADGHQISGETIYAACYAGRDGGPLGGNAWRLLPRKRRARRHRRGASPKPSVLGGFRPISERPESVADRVESGHIEGDLIIGERNGSAVVTLAERTSRLTLLGALPDGYGAEAVAGCVRLLLARLPAWMRRTLTWDQGREMTRWPEVEAGGLTMVYFADPHAPWQRPTNEQNNGVIRHWLPKGTRLDVHTQADLDQVAETINRMPRQLHGWKSAHTVYDDLTVALTA